MRFSIKSLLILTAIVAVWVFVGKGIYVSIPDEGYGGLPNTWLEKLVTAVITPPILLLIISTFTMSFVTYILVLVGIVDKQDDN